MSQTALAPLRALARRAAFRLAVSDALERVVLAAPPLRRAALQRATRYLAGLDEDAALALASTLAGEHLTSSLDLFGESTRDPGRADAIADRYVTLARRLDASLATDLSLDCSHLDLDGDPAGCARRVRRIAEALPAGSRLQLGAEESRRTDATLAIAISAARDGLAVMATVQANLRRSVDDAERLARERVPIRLVKGAYVEPRGVAHPWGRPTDDAYVAIAQRLRELDAPHALATHDAAILSRLASDRPADVEVLLGVRPELARRLVAEGHRVRVYVPYGQRWFRYWARRTAESLGA